MNAATPSILLFVATGQQASESTHKDQSAKARSQQLLELHTKDAASYSIFREPLRTEQLELRREPVYRWTNPARVGGQVGEVFVWTYRGRPEVVGSIFSHPAENSQRVMCHELHSLSMAVLVVDRTASEQWVPQAAGVDLKPVEGAPLPAGTAAQRLAQVRGLAREFTGRSLSDADQAWELRLLPQPLYRYKSTDPDVLDGALFAFVTSAGTDPEALLVLEARKPLDRDPPVWPYGVSRFTDLDLWVRSKGQEVYTAPLVPFGLRQQDPKNRNRVFSDRFILVLEEKAP